MNLAAVLLPTLLLFASVAGASGEPAGGISFMIWGDPAEKKAYETLIRSFSEQHPGVEVELIYTPSQTNYYQRMAVDFAAGTPADVFLINYRRYAHFASGGVLEPLDPYVAGSTAIDLDDFYPEAVAPFYWKGRLLAIPQNISSLVVYYNKDLFDAAGIAYPDSNWTWDEFVETAKALTRDLDGDGTIDQFGLGTDAFLFRVAPFIWQNGGELVDDPVAPTRMALDAPEARTALAWFCDLQLKHKVVPSLLDERTEVSASRFLRGRMGMFFDSRRGTPVYRTIRAFDWDVAPLPRGLRPAGILHSDAFFMASTSRNKAAAWAFIEYANSREGQVILAGTGRTVPSRKAVAESPAFLDPEAKPRNSRVFLDVIPHIRAVPVLDYWPDIEFQAGQEIERTFHGVAPLEEAIRLAQERTAPFFERSNAGEARK